MNMEALRQNNSVHSPDDCGWLIFSPKLDTVALELLEDLTSMLFSAEQGEFDVAMDLLHEQCLVNSHKPKMVTLLRSIEEIVLARQRIVFSAQASYCFLPLTSDEEEY